MDRMGSMIKKRTTKTTVGIRKARFWRTSSLNAVVSTIPEYSLRLTGDPSYYDVTLMNSLHAVLPSDK
jgi:hypothetical protein